jgi:hypothetical protein
VQIIEIYVLFGDCKGLIRILVQSSDEAIEHSSVIALARQAEAEGDLEGELAQGDCQLDIGSISLARALLKVAQVCIEVHRVFQQVLSSV